MDARQEAALRLALENALKFKGKANPNAVLGGLLQTFPELKGDRQTALHLAAEAVASSTAIPYPDGQKARLLELDPTFTEKQQELKSKRKEERSTLPPLPGAEEGKVITRIPPEPSKYNHLGHAMSFLINYLYAKKYQGKTILRFDDTNPEKATQEYVDAVFEDVVSFLSITPDEVKYASENMDRYYQYAEQLIKEGKAYACSCDRDAMSAGRRDMIDCPHRNHTPKENEGLWKGMQAGALPEGSMVLRLKVDMQHKNAVMRDPVIYRLCYDAHYKQGQKFKVWPMYDFECAIEEGLCGVTHVMRSNEFDSRIELQNHIAGLFGFPAVTYIHYGRYNVTGATTQGREIRALIETGDYIGWDDPRLVTIRALRRRGILKEAFYELAQKIGLSKSQTNLDFTTIAAINRKLLDKDAKRYFCVLDPVEVEVSGLPADLKQFSLAYHPEGRKGERVLPVTTHYYLERKDHEAAPEGEVLRFMDAMNVRKKGNRYEFVSLLYDDYVALQKKGPLIHFVPKDGQEVSLEVLLPDLTVKKGVGEANLKALQAGEVIQFERYAFCRLDSHDGNSLKFWFTHE